MKYQTVKSIPRDYLEGCKIDKDEMDGSITMLTITDRNGKVLRCGITSYSFHISIPAPPKMATKFRLSGTVVGIQVTHDFDDRHQADAALQKYEDSVCDPENNCSLKVEEIQIEVTDE